MGGMGGMGYGGFGGGYGGYGGMGMGMGNPMMGPGAGWLQSFHTTVGSIGMITEVTTGRAIL